MPTLLRLPAATVARGEVYSLADLVRDAAGAEPPPCPCCGHGWCPACGTWHYDESFELLVVEQRQFAAHRPCDRRIGRRTAT